jgi:hypothetical protein
MTRKSKPTSSTSSEKCHSDLSSDQFVVEKILNKRIYKGKLQYRIKWLGFTR